MSRRAMVKRTLEISVVLVVEAVLYLDYRQGDGTFHYYTHLFAGATLALLLMTVAARHWGRPIRVPFLAVLGGHLLAMGPDALYVRDMAHQRWMDVFVAHNISHFIPGRNVTWYLLFLAALSLYLTAAPLGLAPRAQEEPAMRRSPRPGASLPGRPSPRRSPVRLRRWGAAR